MAYIKFKELAQYFNFFEEMELEKVPSYVTDYLCEKERLKAVYCTFRDKCAFTDRKMILFDKRGILGKTKKIHFFPYHNVSSTTIQYSNNKVTMILVMDSGYQLRLDFVKMNPEAKKRIRQIYMELVNEMDKVIVEKN